MMAEDFDETLNYECPNCGEMHHVEKNITEIKCQCGFRITFDRWDDLVDKSSLTEGGLL